ncbi:MAG: hypothetical protein IJ115_02110 [Erysipelotrichaceae bacterium]|nr:hypothetical protein [Erysipelotrichaceae bacterium]
MKKYTFEELMNMNAEDLKTLKETVWDAGSILREQRFDEDGPFFKAYDITNVINHGLVPLAIGLGVGYMGYRAVVYYSDKLYRINKEAIRHNSIGRD